MNAKNIIQIENSKLNFSKSFKGFQMMHVLAHPQGMVHATQKQNALTRMEQMPDHAHRLVK